jgi:hypothetical protein
MIIVPQAPSCSDLNPVLSNEDRRRARLWFEFLAVINQAHHSMSEAVQNFFIDLNFNVDWVATEFNYADELQEAAKRKRREREMILGILTGVVLTLGAVTATAALWAGPIVSGINSLAQAGRLGRLGAAASRSSRAIQATARGLKLPAEKGMVTQLETLSNAVGGIIGSGFIGVSTLVKEYAKIEHGKDE